MTTLPNSLDDVIQGNKFSKKKALKTSLLESKRSRVGQSKSKESIKLLKGSESKFPNIKITIPNSGGSGGVVKSLPIPSSSPKSPIKSATASKKRLSVSGLKTIPNIKISKTLTPDRSSTLRPSSKPKTISKIRRASTGSISSPAPFLGGGGLKSILFGQGEPKSSKIENIRIRVSSPSHYTSNHNNHNSNGGNSRYNNGNNHLGGFQDDYQNGKGPGLFERKKTLERNINGQHHNNNNDEGKLNLFSGSRLNISNLHSNILEHDLSIVFRKIGEIKSCKINFDRSGRSNGTGYVIYARHRDAIEAMRVYQGANLDGKPLSITQGSSLQEDISRL